MKGQTKGGFTGKLPQFHRNAPLALLTGIFVVFLVKILDFSFKLCLPGLFLHQCCLFRGAGCADDEGQQRGGRRG